MCRRLVRRRRATHLYASCGNLERDAATYELVLGPDSSPCFDLASLTKGVVTAPIYYAFFEGRQARFHIGDDPILAKAGGVDAIIEHRAGLVDWLALWCRGDELARSVALRSALLSAQPGEALYSDVGYLLLAQLMEENSGHSLGELAEELGTLVGVPAPSFGCPGDDAVPTGYSMLSRRVLRGEVHDENARVMGPHPGHAGCFATGESLTAFLRGFWASSLGRRYFAKNAEKLVATPTRLRPLCGLQQPSVEGVRGWRGAHVVGHLGFTGTCFWVDPADGAYVLLLTNRVVSGRVCPAFAGERAEIVAQLGSLLLGL